MDDLEGTYGLDLYEMMKNVKECNNTKATDTQKTSIFTGPGRYPPCFFGLAYVDPYGIVMPLYNPNNLDDLPEWLQAKGDLWDRPLTDACKFDSWDDTHECVTHSDP